MADIVLHEIPPSPNNVKARVALNYKKIPYIRSPLPFGEEGPDRSQIISVSRQPFTPVMVHGSTVIFDSGGILRYLEANFPKSPPLFSTDYETMRTIENWEMFGRTEVARPVGMIFGQAFAEGKDPGIIDQAHTLLHTATERIEKRLHDGPWLAGETMTAADVVCAAYVGLAMIKEDAAKANPIVAFFREHLRLEKDRDKTREWADRVLAFDR